MKKMKVVTDLKVMECINDSGILTYYEGKALKFTPEDAQDPTLFAPEIVTKYVKGTEFRMMDRDGNVHSTVIGFTDDVYETLGLPLQCMTETVERNMDLVEKNMMLISEKSKLKNKLDRQIKDKDDMYKALIAYKQGIRNMSWWSKLKWLFGAEPNWINKSSLHEIGALSNNGE